MAYSKSKISNLDTHFPNTYVAYSPYLAYAPYLPYDPLEPDRVWKKIRKIYVTFNKRYNLYSFLHRKGNFRNWTRQSS